MTAHRQVFKALACCITMLLALRVFGQATVYWDTNGATAGAGGATPSGTWNAANTNWTANSLGTAATTTYTSGSNVVFSAGSDATGAYTVTVTGTQNVNNLTANLGNPTLSGGTLNFSAAGGALTVAAGSTLTTTGILAGTATLNKNGAGTFVTGGTSTNTQSGNLNVNAGTFEIEKSGFVGAIFNTSAVTVAAGANLTFNGDTGYTQETMGSLAGAGTVTNIGAAVVNVIAGGDNTSTTFSGTLTNTTNAINLQKSGTGTMTLSGANTFAGTTTVNAGKLQIGATNALPTGTAVTVASGATLDVNNFTQTVGSIAGTGSVTLGTGALTAGGNNTSTTFGGTLGGTGTFTKAGTGTLSLSSNIGFGGTFVLSAGTLQLSGTTLTLGTLDVTGNSVIDFSGAAATLNVTNLFIQAGSTLSIINWQNGTDFFYASNWSGASYYTAGSNPMNQVSFNGFSANNTRWQSFDNQITPVPEPSVYGASLLAAGILVCGIYKKRSKNA